MKQIKMISRCQFRPGYCTPEEALLFTSYWFVYDHNGD